MSGFDKLKQQVLDFVAGEMDWLPDEAIGDSPIEKLLFTALVARIRFGGSEYEHLVVPGPYAPVEELLDGDKGRLVVVPQVEAAGWRVDFLVHCWDFGRATGRQQWRKLIVECDGHAYHERTKDQAARDRSRDREAQNQGYGILRFTGSEIYRDPLGCAAQITDWAARGWG